MITLTKKLPIFKLFTSPALSPFPFIFLFALSICSCTHTRQSAFVLFEDWGQLLVTIISPACHEGRHNADTEAGDDVTSSGVTCDMRCHESTSNVTGLVTLVTLSFKIDWASCVPGYWSGITFSGEAGTRAVQWRHGHSVPLHRLS